MSVIPENEAAFFSGPPVSLISETGGGFFLFCGDLAAAALPLWMIAWRVLQGERVLFLDGDNRFDLYPIVDLAKRIGHDPKSFLASLFVSRAFTCHQMAVLITNELETGIERHRPRLILLAEPLATFYDEAVPLAEARALLARAVAYLTRVSREGLWVVILTAPPPSSHRRASLFSLISSAADRIFSVRGAQEEVLIQEESNPTGLRAARNPLRRTHSIRNGGR